MKTVIIKKIDEHEIVRGFSTCQRDPVETQRAVVEAVKDNPVYVAYLKSQLALANEYKCLRIKHGNGVKLSSQKLNKLHNKHAANTTSYKKLLTQCTLDCARFFGPRSREQLNDDAVLREAYRTLPAGHVLTIDGDVFVNNRGVSYLIKRDNLWRRETIDRIGVDVPWGAVLLKNVTDEQRQQALLDAETLRIQGLSTTEKKIELENQKQMALRRAALYRSEIEIEGATPEKALKISREFHQSLTTEIEQRYE